MSEKWIYYIVGVLTPFAVILLSVIAVAFYEFVKEFRRRYQYGNRIANKESLTAEGKIVVHKTMYSKRWLFCRAVLSALGGAKQDIPYWIDLYL